MFDLARITVTASRSLRTWKASTGGTDPFSDSEPAVVGTSAVLKLSLTISGTQCSGPKIWRDRDIAAGWRAIETPCASLPTRSPSQPRTPARKAGVLHV